MGAHCYGKDCVDYHKLALANSSIPVRYLKTQVHVMEKQADGIVSILEELKVPHLKVLYEKLYYAKRADQWMDLFRFLGVGPMSGLEMEHVRAVGIPLFSLLDFRVCSTDYGPLTFVRNLLVCLFVFPLST